MSGPQMPHSGGENSGQYRGRGQRRGFRRPFSHRGQHSHRSTSRSENVQYPSRSNQIVDRLDGEFRSFQPDENQDRSDSQSSSHSSQVPQRRRDRNRPRYKKDSSERGQSNQRNKSSTRYSKLPEKENVQQPPESKQFLDYWDLEMKPLQPDENQGRGDSRSSSPFSQSSQGTFNGRRDHRNRGRYQKESNESAQSNQRNKFPSRYSKFGQLMGLSNMNGNDIASEISDNRDFKLLLNSEMNKDFLVMTLRVLALLTEANFTRIVINILSEVCESKFFDTLKEYLVALTSDTRENIRPNKFYWEDVNKFWNHLHDVLKTVIDLVPIQSHDGLLPALELIRGYVIQTVKMRNDHNLSDDVLPRFQNLYHQLKEKTKKFAPVAGNKMLQDFRNLSIIPSVEDLNDNEPYIRPCKIQGGYDSVDHYLDVQFRLLREDFVCPLRAGIQEYKRLAEAHVRTPQISDIRVFEKVKLIGPTVVKNNVGITIFFGIIPKMNWNRSKHFMYGSLLCLTNDNFQSVVFATVAERDSKLLAKGELIIEPCVGTRITRDMYSSEYVMVESKVYFLPYYHTLSSLRYMTEETFPMKRYVVDAESDPKPPKYLDKHTIYVYKGFEIPIMEERRWPNAKRLQLDESQYEAFKSALLQELSVLHGPPGTGKTFMALQIASTLLNNSSSWYDPAHPTPMIVVCLTNHALDQFLEGILSYTDSLIRIGEQSKNPSLTQYKLKAVRENYYQDATKKRRAWKRMDYYRRQSKKFLESLAKSYSVLRALTSNTSIVSPNVFRQYCDDDEVKNLNATSLLIKLFGLRNASLVMEIDNAPSKSAQSVEDDLSESEDGYITADDELEVASVVHTNNSEYTALEISFLDAAIDKCETELTINQANTDNQQNDELITELTGKLKQLQSLRNIVQAKLSRHPLHVNESGARNYQQDREWAIYCHWLTSSYEVVKQQIVELEKDFEEVSSQLNDFKQMTDVEVMRNSKVIGLTTTGAARLHESLRALRSPIVLVEEAAEILEAHVICSLTEHCQQVILIGDHKQLRPKPATYDLEVNYNMNISLFERIVKMRDKCTQLVIQHRMRPQIAELLTPSIYEKLENHVSVYTYPAVKGLEKNLFFINHQNRELGSSQNESMSNPYEVKFLLAFAKYLIQQGYTPLEITILCTYSGQLFKFKEAKKGMQMLRDVRVTTVDNYQGEENRIILLSLVRNNNAGNIGFLKTENRVCVALSRAREGLYIMGNMNNLLMKNQIWPKIKQALEDNDAIGDSLVLQCQIHPDQYTQIKCPADFKKSPNGGCLRQCGADLPCGHTCNKRCHILDKNHENYDCIEPCMQKCSNGHLCKLLCKAACKPCQETVTVELECKHTVDLLCCTDLKEFQCAIKVPTILRCGHLVQKPCHREASTYPCSHICKQLLACGHTCVRKCHIDDDPGHAWYQCREDCKKAAAGCPQSHPCPKKCHEPCEVCTEKIPKERSCGHIHKIECLRDVEKIICTRRCKRSLPCGHACKEKCNLPCGNCEEVVDKVVPGCGHEVKVPCGVTPTVKICNGQCPRILKCGHPCKSKCSEICTERCEYPRPLSEPALCQHVFPVPCYKIEAGLAEYADKLLQHCPTPCATLLPCGHVCSGSCGSCKQGRIHQPCREHCSQILICGHKCESLCREPCRPCQKVCSIKCEHNECKHKCGVSCTLCKEPCSWQCKHFKCKKLCFEICDKSFCNEPCPERLECGHPCIGFCGEPCPPLCRICNAKDLPTLIHDKNKPEPRFVYLAECGHCIESNYLDYQWQNSYKIGIKVCPICTNRITYCKRYANQLKKERKNMEIVKQEVFRRLKCLRADEQKILNDINNIEREYAMHFPGLKTCEQFFESLRALANQQNISKTSAWKLKDISSKLTIAGIILREFKEIPRFYRTMKYDGWPVIFNQIIMLLTSLITEQNISDQTMDDVGNELSRLHYMIQFCKFEGDTKLNKKENALQVEVIYLGLLNLRKFTNFRSDAMYKQLSNLKNSLHSSVAVNEWKQIKIRVMGVEEKDWWRCSHGHIYVIKCEQCSIPSAPIELK